jgi:hypothetical protein
MTTVFAEIDPILSRAIESSRRICIVGDPPVASEVKQRAQGQVVHVSVAQDARGEFDLIVCGPASATSDLRGGLVAGGSVCVDLSAPAGRQDDLRDSVREVVKALSAAGFVIQKPRAVHEPAQELPASPLLIARADVFRIRHYEQGDEREILDLFEKSFHVRRGVDHWEWEYKRNPWGATRISLAVDESGAIVAQYAGYPVPVWSDGWLEGKLAIQIGDTMTEVGVRNVGRGHTMLLCRAVRDFYATFCEEQVAFTYGFNTANIQKISTTFVGATRVESVGYWTRPLAPVETRRPSVGKRLLRGVISAAVEAPGAGFDEFYRRVAPSYGLLVERGAAYLAWRFATSPFDYRLVAARRRGRLVGWGVFRRRDAALVLVDALFDERQALEAAAAVLRAGLALPVADGAQRLVAWFPERPAWWPPTLAALGFERSQEPDDLALMCVPFTEADAPQQLARSLYYTAGDSDLF